MLRVTEIKLDLDHSDADLRAALRAALGIDETALLDYTVRRRGYDARQAGVIRLVYTIDASVADPAAVLRRHQGNPRVVPRPDETYRYPALSGTPAKRPVVVGTGPCGLFAGLALAEMGLRPLILERGKIVRERTRDVWEFWRKRELNPESNVQFGEGGAGTFSDGKLYSGVKDRGHRGRKVLQELVAAGAPAEILYISKPHIGTLRLVKVVENLRHRIVALGGEIRFDSRVTDLLVENGAVCGLTLAGGGQLAADEVVLAVGHSARDTFQMLYERGVHIEAKPFSIGFRIEHPQAMIDQVRLGRYAGHPMIGAADYKLVHHCRNGRAVYSFCMCPGGQVVAASSEAGRVVTNGMSHYSRNERNANSGIVVDLAPADYGNAHPLAGVAFQRQWESLAYALGGGDYNAPAQLVGDFLARRPSTAFGEVLPSYTPAVTLTDLNSALPAFAIDALHEALPALDKQLRGYARPDAVLTGVETRTSSPIRITRGADFQSLNTRGLYPAGEGAGYAGGILSAAIDGLKVAEAVAVAMTGSRKVV